MVKSTGVAAAGAEEGARELPDQVEFGIRCAVAEIAIDAADGARRLEAPAAVVEANTARSRKLQGPIILPY